MSGKKSVYNPFQDGPVACIWELARRNESIGEVFHHSTNTRHLWIKPQILRVLFEVFYMLGKDSIEKFKEASNLRWPELPADLRGSMEAAYKGDDSLSAHNPIPLDLGKLLEKDDEMLRSQLMALHRKGVSLLGVYPTDFDTNSRKKFEERMWLVLTEESSGPEIKIAIEKTIKEQSPEISPAELKRKLSNAQVHDEEGKPIDLKIRNQPESFGSEQSWEAFIWDEYFSRLTPKSKRIPARGKKLIEVIRKVHNLKEDPENSVEITSRATRTKKNIEKIRLLIKNLIG
tara:strand:- start:2587 stop:3450 length:864 start_codon:yes stop_codon:yes gene_type:complete